jgi:hypothetical protein
VRPAGTCVLVSRLGNDLSCRSVRLLQVEAIRKSVEAHVTRDDGVASSTDRVKGVERSELVLREESRRDENRVRLTTDLDQAFRVWPRSVLRPDTRGRRRAWFLWTSGPRSTPRLGASRNVRSCGRRANRRGRSVPEENPSRRPVSGPPPPRPLRSALAVLSMSANSSRSALSGSSSTGVETRRSPRVDQVEMVAEFFSQRPGEGDPAVFGVERRSQGRPISPEGK